MTEENVIKVQTEGLSSIRVQVCADVLRMTIADHSEGKSVAVTLSRQQVNDLAISLLILKKRLQESGASV